MQKFEEKGMQMMQEAKEHAETKFNQSKETASGGFVDDFFAGGDLMGAA